MSRPIRFVLAVLVGFSAMQAAALDRDAAYVLLNERSAANRAGFYVYHDADSAFNHGTASGLFGATGKTHLDAACVDDASSASGCSGDLTRLDRVRGNVLRVSFDALASGETAGVTFEEPFGWSVQQTGKGFDLSGATSISFDVRSPSPGGISVQFGVDGRMTDFVHIPQGNSFTTMTIPLQSLSPTAPSLLDVHGVFTVATDGGHAPGGGAILVDNVRYLPAPDSRRRAIGFPVASETFGMVPTTSLRAGRVQIPIDQAWRNASTISDSALTLMALLDRGTAEDKANAEAIADAFHHALHHDSELRQLSRIASLALPTGKVSIRNGYKAGDLTFLNDEIGARADEARLAGFTSSPEVCGASSYCFVLDGAAGRNIGVAILALVAAHDVLGKDEYLSDAQLLATWVANELGDPSASGFGGYYRGYADQQDPKQLVRTKSAEDNAVLFAAFSRLAAAEGLPRAGAIGGISRWTSYANVAGDFVMRLYDAGTGRFYAGTVPVGTDASFGVVPNGSQLGNDVINTFESAEANTLAVLALASAGRYRGAIDWRKPLQWLAGRTVAVDADGTTYGGVGFGPAIAVGPAGISWALTAQAIVAMRLIDCLHGATFQAAIADSSAQIALAQSTAPFGDGKGVVSSTLANGSNLPPAEHCLSTPGDCIPQRVGLATTVWSIFADRGRNPLSSKADASLCPGSRRRAVR